MGDCKDLLKSLGDYIDGDLEPGLCAELESHMHDCVDCRLVVDSLKKTITVYRAGKPDPLPEKFSARLHKALQERWKTR